MNTLYALTIIITSLTTGQVIEETAKVKTETKEMCEVRGDLIAWRAEVAFRITSAGINLRVDHRCDRVPR